MQVTRQLARAVQLTGRLTAGAAPRGLNRLRMMSTVGGEQSTPSSASVGQRLAACGATSHALPRALCIADAVAEAHTNMVRVKWGDGVEDLYPWVWLRDNCQCPTCFHPTAKARTMSMLDLALSASPSEVQVREEGGEVTVLWSDGHLGMYPAQWLHDRAFNGRHVEKWSQVYSLDKKFWGNELQEKLKKFAFPVLLRDDSSFLSFLETLEVEGVAVVREVPQQEGMIKRLTQRIGYLKPSHYGETFSVHVKVDASNVAYTAGSLDMHGDLTYITEKPGVQMLHCIKQVEGEGGDNLLVDSIHVARQLQKKHPDMFHILADTVVTFSDVGSDSVGDFHTYSRVPTIECDSDGNIKGANISHHSRDSVFTVSPERALAWYKAFLTFRDMLYSPKNYIKYKMGSGEMLVIDNHRVLHGRLSYEDAGGERHLEGGYWDWDLVRSRRRVLRNQLDKI